MTTAPDSPQNDPAVSLLHRGLAAHRSGDTAAADALYRQVLAAQPTQADALYLLATIRLGQHQVPEAVALLRRAVAAQPGFTQARQLLGEALEASGDIPGAIAAWRAALALQPDLAELHLRLGRLLFGHRETEAAAACFRAAVALRPQDAGNRNNLAIALQTLGDAEGAVAEYRRALELRPDAADIHTNLGCSLLTLNDWAGAVASHRRALALRPGYGAALTNLAAALGPDQPDPAIACYREALAGRPGLTGQELAEAHYSLGLRLLREGRYPEGWAEAEWWDRTALGSAGQRRNLAPPWDGAAGDGTLLVYAQQGLGDTLQFTRFVALAAARRPVVLEAPRSLLRLLATLAPVRQGRVRLQAPGSELPPHDAACSLLSLPHLLGVTLENLPGETPYLHADPRAADRWASRLAALPGLKVGLAWAGNPLLGGRASPLLADRRRSLVLAQLAGMAGIEGVSLVSLQKGEPARQTPPPGLVLHDWTGELHDFADTAALVAGLDLVISVDTSVVHLAGALGRPVWLLNRWDGDWRWLRGRDDSPWYPTLRQFRQSEPGAWEAPLAALCAALADLAEPNPGVLYNQAHEAAAAGKPDTAISLYRRVVARAPALAEAHNNLANLLLAAHRHQEALAGYDAALAARPGYVEALANRGMALKPMDRLDEAEAALRQAVALRPDLAGTHNALGTTLAAQGRLAAALASLASAAGLAPGDAMIAVNTGLVLAGLNRLPEAIASHRRAIALAPDLPDAHLALAEALLQDGQLREGWREYEWRWHSPAAHRRAFTQPRWDRSSPAGGTVLLHAEQGLGDTLQFCRYVPLVARHARVVLEAPAPLLRLLGGLEGVAELVATGDPLPAFDRQCPLLSLPLAFGTRLSGIPAETPYLQPLASDAARWRARLAALPGRRVGLCWAGNAALADIRANPIDRRRSLPEGALAPLADLPGISFVSLQKGAAPPPGLVLHDWTAELHDFADTAALLAGLDLVISVDTAVAHLAGSLGQPVWLLNRHDSEWRWLLGREDSPWYPSLRQFRQAAYGDWTAPLAAVRDALAE